MVDSRRSGRGERAGGVEREIADRARELGEQSDHGLDRRRANKVADGLTVAVKRSGECGDGGPGDVAEVKVVLDNDSPFGILPVAAVGIAFGDRRGEGEEVGLIENTC